MSNVEWYDTDKHHQHKVEVQLPVEVARTTEIKERTWQGFLALTVNWQNSICDVIKGTWVMFIGLVQKDPNFLWNIANIVCKFQTCEFTKCTNMTLKGVSIDDNRCFGHIIESYMYCIAENFHKFHGFVAIRKSFLHEIWGVASFGMAKASNPRKFSLRKTYFSPICKSFLPWKFLAIRYVEGNQLPVNTCCLEFQLSQR